MISKLSAISRQAICGTVKPEVTGTLSLNAREVLQQWTKTLEQCRQWYQGSAPAIQGICDTSMLPKHTQNVIATTQQRPGRLISWTHGHFSSINEDHFKSMMNSVYQHFWCPSIPTWYRTRYTSPVVSQNEKEDKKNKKKLISKQGLHNASRKPA